MKTNVRHFGWTLLIALGCGSGGDEDAKSSATLSPEDLCAKKCQLQVGAGCAKTPPDYLMSCTAICLVKYTKHAECDAKMRPLDACAIDRVSYVCSNDAIMATPAGACASEGAACASCTGDFTQCL